MICIHNPFNIDPSKSVDHVTLILNLTGGQLDGQWGNKSKELVVYIHAIYEPNEQKGCGDISSLM